LRLLDNFQNFLLVASGAVFGANIRFIIYQRLEKINLKKNDIILTINTFSSFFLGLFLAILSNSNYLIDPYQLGLFFSIGLLGSLSTFSTFVFDLYEFFLQLKFYKGFQLFIISMILGILAFAIGFWLVS
tara:strand:- start:645 stop:1034 length:390 start_codon:yes stop_codon:yes gene_type:complete